MLRSSAAAARCRCGDHAQQMVCFHMSFPCRLNLQVVKIAECVCPPTTVGDNDDEGDRDWVNHAKNTFHDEEAVDDGQGAVERECDDHEGSETFGSGGVTVRRRTHIFVRYFLPHDESLLLYDPFNLSVAQGGAKGLG